MARIPSYEDLGNEPMVVEADKFFDTLARGYVDGHLSVDVDILALETSENYDFSHDPFQAMRDAGPGAVEAARGRVVYAVHVALHNVWAETFRHEHGPKMRDVLMRNYIGISRHNERDVLQITKRPEET